MSDSHGRYSRYMPAQPLVDAQLTWMKLRDDELEHLRAQASQPRNEMHYYDPTNLLDYNFAPSPGPRGSYVSSSEPMPQSVINARRRNELLKQIEKEEGLALRIMESPWSNMSK